MDDAAVYLGNLTEALEKRRDWLDRQEMPKLKEEYRIFQAAFMGLYNVLLKKGVLHEDPYKNDVKIGDLQVPSEAPFAESEKADQISIRASHYASQLDFLISYYQFSVDFMTMARLKTLLGLTKYFAWTQMSANSQHTNTRTLAELIGQARAGNDNLTIGLIADALQHLERSTKNILKLLKDVSDYHRENYKMELRLRVVSAMSFDTATVIGKIDDTVRQVKRRFAEAMADRPFYPELVEEVIREDYASEGQNLRAEVLKGLLVPEDKPKTAKEVATSRPILLEGLRILSVLSFTLEDAGRKLDENSAILEARKNTMWDKLRRLFRQVFNRPDEDVFYEVEYFDTISGASTTERLDYRQFAARVDRMAKFLAALNNKASNTVKRLESANEDQLLGALIKNLEELQSIHKTMIALDLFFKSETAREDRDRLHGIKPELTGIKSSLVKANQKRHEYIAQKEELDQMKRLGIRGEV
jgi:hypothetical protein